MQKSKGPWFLHYSSMSTTTHHFMVRRASDTDKILAADTFAGRKKYYRNLRKGPKFYYFLPILVGWLVGCWWPVRFAHRSASTMQGTPFPFTVQLKPTEDKMRKHEISSREITLKKKILWKRGWKFRYQGSYFSWKENSFNTQHGLSLFRSF